MSALRLESDFAGGGAVVGPSCGPTSLPRRRPASVCVLCLRDMPKGESLCYTCKRELSAEARKPVPPYIPRDYETRDLDLIQVIGLKESRHMKGDR